MAALSARETAAARSSGLERRSAELELYGVAGLVDRSRWSEKGWKI